MTKFRPLHDRVLVLPDGAAPKTGGLAAPPSQKDEPTQGVVVAAGPQALLRAKEPYEEYIDGAGRRCLRYSGGVALGWRVQWVKYSGREVEHEGRKHKLLRLEEIDGVLEDE